MIKANLNYPLESFDLDATFQAPTEGITVVCGASGSGKTTLLRCIAGLQRARGRLAIGDELWQDDASSHFRLPHERPIGFVFQDARLFAHLSVRDNLLFGARRVRDIAGSSHLAFDDVTELLSLRSLLGRTPTNLSGGERQRIAIGRALLAQPSLLLMDEPLSSLDTVAKEEILACFELVRTTYSIPMLYVTHAMYEADRLADHLIVLERGQIIAAGALGELEARPDLPLLQAPDAVVTLEGCVTHVDSHYALTSVEVPGGVLVIPGHHGSPGSRKRLRIGVSDVSFTLVRPSQTTMLNCLPARIMAVAPKPGDLARVHVIAALGEDGSGASIAGRITRKSLDTLNLHPGLEVFAMIKSVALSSPIATTTQP